MDEEIYDIEFTKVIKTNNNLVDFKFEVFGYPKEQLTGITIKGKIIDHKKHESKNIDYIMSVHKEDSLQSYKGLSGSPIFIYDYIVGVLIQQNTSDNLFGISINLIDDILLKENNVLVLDTKDLRNVFYEVTII